MKKLLVVLICIAASFGIASASEAFPNKPVKIVLSLGVGSGPDVMARKIAEVLTEKWRQPVIVENRPGGGGVIGLNYINNEPANGYTIGFLDGGTVVSYATLYKNKDPISQLEPIMPVLDANMALFASSQIQNYTELKQEIQKNPSYSSWNIGSIGHVLGAEYLLALNVKGAHVPYKDFGQWQADVSNKQVSYAFGSTGTIKNMVQAGKNQIFAIAAQQRDPRYPSVPTVSELTGKNLNTLIAWCSFYVPVATPANVKTQLEKDLRDAVTDRRVQDTMVKFDYISLHTMSLSDFKKKVKTDQDVYSNIIVKNNIEVQ